MPVGASRGGGIALRVAVGLGEGGVVGVVEQFDGGFAHDPTT
ncbi:hypothetical protein OUQ99_18790 [Streptomonospora nanhaiensis]|uniref:Uncharacterized protein n=1 Tax=Streptomonospora nanhaiensis TaxID=1323731 RepID=A0ABY6YGA0_9ACTN|nr:hypothetical protein [Streptomonospora nanhaiensis]WAE71279.1 hypothetical protein OUQ99_18790 [Streptomonospora nanhaiensis]